MKKVFFPSIICSPKQKERRLDSVATVLNRAGNFAWRGIQATVRLLDTLYEKGVKLCGKEKDVLEKRLLRSQDPSLSFLLIS